MNFRWSSVKCAISKIRSQCGLFSFWRERSCSILGKPITPARLFSVLVSRDTGDILLKICNLMPQDTGIYTCVAVNDHGTASSSASIKVQGENRGYESWKEGCGWSFDLLFVSLVKQTDHCTPVSLQNASYHEIRLLSQG